MSHTITLLPNDNTEEITAALEKISSASSRLLQTTIEEKNSSNYEVCQAESSLSIEANKVASIAEDALLSCR